ncbi:MAG: hypothetical protein FWB91_11015 [Defluviitaleaceae bacterium]|nr:hypothetical protein [Defluviitaleaceae bacterium]
MARKIFYFCLVMTAMLMTTSCMYDYGTEVSTQSPQGHTSQPIDPAAEAFARERLLELGWDEESLDSFVRSNISLENIYNQMRFGDAAQALAMGDSAVPSGGVIAPQYMGAIRFDDRGFLNVAVLPEAFDHPASAAAIYEMREMGIIVYAVRFNQQELTATIDRLNDLWEAAREVGATSWGQGAENGVTLWLDPYTPEQKVIFAEFLRRHNINPDIIILQPAVTQEMRDFRANRIAEAIQQPADRIVLVGDVEVSRTGIAFSLENRTSEEFTYGAPWDLAYFHEGRWLPVPHLPGAGSGMWTMQAYMLQAGGIQQYRINFEWFFGELAPGRYMFIRDGWTGYWSESGPGTYAFVEFEVTATTQQSLPNAPEPEWPPSVNVVSHSEVTPTGMRVVVENNANYDIDHRAQIIFIVPAEHTTVGYRWEWWEYHLPILPFEGDWESHFVQGHGFLPVGGQLEFELDWTAIFGELPPGDYKIDLSLGGQAHPPHPTGWAFGEGLIAFTVGG